MSLAELRGLLSITEKSWSARVLPDAPLIAPARQFTFPYVVAGEEDALARGALWLEVRTPGAGTWLAQCALGFAGSGVAHGLWPLPGSGLLACAGGYGYAIDPFAPETTVLLPARPVVGVMALPDRTVLVTHHGLVIREADGSVWTTPRLSWEGVTITSVIDNRLQGLGWDMVEDVEAPFSVDLRSRAVRGGGFDRRRHPSG